MITISVLSEEKKLIADAINRESINDVQAFLACSGLREIKLIEEYKDKFKDIVSDFETFRGQSPQPISLEEALYEFVPNGCPTTLFHEAIDNYITGKDVLGNCWIKAGFIYALGSSQGLEFEQYTDPDPNEELGHVFVRSKNTGIVIDPSMEKFGKMQVPYQEKLDFVEFLAVNYLNRLDLVSDPNEKALLCGMALQLAPERPEGYNELATVHMEYQGRKDVAIQLCRKAVELSKGTYPVCRANLALAYSYAGYKDKALFELTKIERDYPQFHFLPKIKETIQSTKK